MKQPLHQLNQSCLAADMNILGIFFLLCCCSLGNRKPRCLCWVNIWLQGFCSHWLGSVLTLEFSSPWRWDKTKAQIRGKFPFPLLSSSLGQIWFISVGAEGGDCWAWGKNLRQTWMCWVWKKSKNKEVGESSKYGNYASPSYSAFLLHFSYTMLRAIAGRAVERWGI